MRFSKKVDWGKCFDILKELIMNKVSDASEEILPETRTDNLCGKLSK